MWEKTGVDISGSAVTSAHSYPQHYMEMSDQLDATVTLTPRKEYLYHIIT
jgi:hypothetical protein